MQIIHLIDDFLFEIFPELKGADKEKIIEVIKNYYTYRVFEPKVEIKDDIIIVDIDTTAIENQESDYLKVVNLCEKGKFNEARPILTKLLEVNPTNSEYHRIMGQIYSEEGDNDSAIDTLIDALRWNPKNGWALLLMGNILAKYNNDIATAMKYYDHALKVNPTDHIVRNNIGANLLQQGKFDEAKKYFLEAVSISDSYPNTHYALGMIYEREGALQEAFDSTIKSIKTNKSKDVLYQNSLRQVFQIFERINETTVGEEIYNEFKERLTVEGGVPIEIVEDNDIHTTAKFEFAENHKRNNHLIKYKPDHPAIEHLIMHELMHLEFVIQARKNNQNQLFITSQKHKKEFLNKSDKWMRYLSTKGLSKETILKFLGSMFDGLNQQIYNAPIDLFIENILYNTYPTLRPFQFISLYRMYLDAVKAVTDKRVLDTAPTEIISKSKTYNLVLAYQFKDLFGIDLIDDFHGNQKEIKQAKDFYEEFIQYRDDKEPAEEYELIQHWAEDLGLDNHFDIVLESEYRSRDPLNNLIKSIEEDPLGLKDPVKEQEMKQFLKSQEEMGLNMAVVMYMVDAMQYFESKSLQEIKKIAIEIAMQGTQGYHPDKEYRINSIKGKVFTGYHILAYYYVSFAIAIPEMLSQMQLPYDEEYKLAQKMHKTR